MVGRISRYQAHSVGYVSNSLKLTEIVKLRGLVCFQLLQLCFVKCMADLCLLQDPLHAFVAVVAVPGGQMVGDF